MILARNSDLGQNVLLEPRYQDGDVYIQQTYLSLVGTTRSGPCLVLSPEDAEALGHKLIEVAKS